MAFWNIHFPDILTAPLRNWRNSSLSLWILWTDLKHISRFYLLLDMSSNVCDQMSNIFPVHKADAFNVFIVFPFCPFIKPSVSTWLWVGFSGFSDEQQTVFPPWAAPRGSKVWTQIILAQRWGPWEGHLRGVSGAPGWSPTPFAANQLRTSRSPQVFWNWRVSVSSFGNKLDHWLQSKTSWTPDRVLSIPPSASYCLEHHMSKFHLMDNPCETSPWDSIPARGSAFRNRVWGLSGPGGPAWHRTSVWSVHFRTFQKHTPAGRPGHIH